MYIPSILKARRQDRDLPEEELNELIEHHRLLTKTAMRCAYDLVHAAALIRDEELQQEFDKRAKMWLGIFDPGGIKRYRDELHQALDDKDRTIQHLRDLLEEHGIEDPDKIPF